MRAVRCVLRAERVHSPCLTIARAAPGSGAGRNPDGLLLAHASGACGHLHRPKHGCGRDRRRGSGCLVGVTGSPVRPRAGPVPVQALCSRCEHMRLRCRGVYPTGKIVQGMYAVNGGIWCGVNVFVGDQRSAGGPDGSAELAAGVSCFARGATKARESDSR
jgi:hypothetical protein